MTTGKNASFFMLITLTLRFRGYESWRLLARGAGDAFDHSEDGGNKESADERFRDHTSDYRRPHDLACHGACSGRCPERDATEDEGERGHHEGAEALPRRGECRINDGHASFFVILLSERDDQNRVLRCQTDQHHQADLGINVVLHLHHVRRQVKAHHEAPQPKRGQGAEYRHRRAEQHAEGQTPAFIERRQDEENEEQRKPEDDRSRDPLFRLHLLIRHAYPVVTHFGRHGLLEEIHEGRSCLVGAITWRGGGIDLCGAVLVIAHGELGTGSGIELRQRGEWHRLPLSVADIELSEIVGGSTVRRFRLHIHLPGASEIVVVVDEQSAHVSLNGVVNIGQSHALLQDFAAIHIDELLRDAGNKRGADLSELRAFAGGRHEFVQVVG